jgi:hypothetical protein
MNSRKLYEFLELFNLEKKFKNRGTMTGRNRPKVARAWPSPAAKSASMAHTGQRSRAHARSPCAAPTGQHAVDGDLGEEVLQLWWHENEHR